MAVLYRQGDTNAALQTLLDAAPPPGDPASPLDPSAYLPAHASHYRYSGSLTTPPCTEGVQWLVLTEVAEVSGEQLRHIADLTGDTPNNRPIQPLGDRIDHAGGVSARRFQVFSTVRGSGWTLAGNRHDTPSAAGRREWGQRVRGHDGFRWFAWP